MAVPFAPGFFMPKVGANCDPFWDDVVLLARFNEPAGSHLMPDSSSYDQLPVPNIDLFETVSSPQVFNNNVGAFTAATVVVDACYYAHSSSLQLGTGDFTIEGFVWIDSYHTVGGVPQPAGFVGKRSMLGNSPDSWIIFSQTTGEVCFTEVTGSGFTNRVFGSISLGAWYYFAVTRDGNTVRGYFGSVSSGTANKGLQYTTSHNFNADTNNVWLGCNSTLAQHYLKGKLESIRITKGRARYTDNTSIPVPTVDFPVVGCP